MLVRPFHPCRRYLLPVIGHSDVISLYNAVCIKSVALSLIMTDPSLSFREKTHRHVGQRFVPTDSKEELFMFPEDAKFVILFTARPPNCSQKHINSLVTTATVYTNIPP